MKPLSLVLFLWTFLSVEDSIGVGASVSNLRGWINESWSENTTTYRHRRDVDRSLPNDGETSLVFIFDDTGSMHDDLVHLRLGAKSIVAEFEKRVNNPIYNYILVRFNDPRVSDAFKTLEPEELLKALDEIKVDGGGDCPELAFQGIINGINAALPRSPVFVFTDATAKDSSLLDDAINLARGKSISVSLLLSGNGCNSGDFPHLNTLAKRSSGQVYNVAKSNVEDVVRSIAEVIDKGLVPLESTYFEEAGTHDFEIDVDDSMKKLVTSVTGKKPRIDFTNPHKEKNKNVINILDIPTARIDKVDNPELGKWNITTSSDSPHSIKISGVSDILVRYGFSYILPEEYSDTAPVPIKDISNYLSMFVWKNNRNHTFTHAELVIVTSRAEISHANHTLKILDSANCDSDLCIYATEAFIPPLDTFKIFVRGIDSAGNPVKYLVSTNIETVPGDNLKPKVNISSSEVKVKEGDDVHLVCKVTSTKRSVINWYFEDNVVEDRRNRRVNHKGKEVNLDFYGITLDDSGSYHCKAKNPYGQHHEKVKIFVEAIPWNIEMHETDMKITENEVDYEIKCKITPEERKVTVKWIFNGAPVTESADLQILGDTLLLKTVNRRHEGNFTCEGTFNGVPKSSSGHLVVQYPPIILGPAYEKRLVQFDDKVVLECSAEGNPKPKISWIRENGTLSNGVIEKFSPADYGLHTCQASNGVGSVARKNVMIETKYGLKPKVMLKINKPTVNEDDTTQLSCEVTSPKPVDVKWIFNDGHKITESPHRQIISDKDNTMLVLHKAQLEDVGTYSCVAENSFGKDKESVNLKVVSIPLDIKIAQPRIQVTENDKNVTMECVVQPKKRRLNLKWMFNERLLHNSDEFQIFGNKLIFKNVHRSHTGDFTCVGEFHGETKTAKGYLNVLYSPEIIGATKERRTIKFDERVSLNCSAVGNPEPKISWFRDDESDASPIIEKFSPDHYGNHICEASNGVGAPVLKVVFLNSTAGELPKLITSDYYHEVKTEQNLTLKCRCKQCGPIRYSEWERLDDGKRLISGVKGHSEEGSQDYNFDLHLVNVTSSHTNRYMCIIGNEFGIAKAAMRVNVTDQPTIKGIVARGADSSTAEVIKVQPGKQVILTCLVVGSPKPAVRWYKNEKVLPPDPSFMDNILRIERVSENDNGKYTCKATNSLGTMSKDIKLLVIQSNFPMNTILITDEGQTISLPCESRTWLLNDDLLDVSKARYTLIENILVFNAKYEDSGVYQCLSLNETSASAPGETVLMVQTAPAIIPNEDDNTRVRKSREAILKCKSQGYPLPEISWTFNRRNLSNSPAYEILQGGDLKIKSAREKNAGLYTCRASNKIGHVERGVNVIVTVPPKITSEFNSTWRISPGDTSSLLTCSASGKPVPGVSWLRDGKVHVGERPAENFLNIGPYMVSGNYTCIAKNLDGVDTRSIIVTSRGPPILSDRHHQTRYHIFEGSEFNLLCPFTNAKDIVWFKDGVKLYGIRSGPQELLTIPLAERVHAGSYTCTASNNYGEGSFVHHVHIFPSEHPYPDDYSYESVKEVQGNDVVLNCRIGGDIPHHSKWIRNNRVVSIGPRLELKNLQLNDTGKYECKDVDEDGYINQSTHLTVASRPEVQMAKETWIAVKEGDNLELECKIAGIPVPTILWTKDSSPVASATNTILTIRGATSDAAGTYKCSGINDLGVADIVHHVDVLRAPQIKVGNREIMLRQNDEVTFACEATGNPLPTLVWSFQGSKLLGTESIPISKVSAYSNIYLNHEGVIVRKSNVADELRANVKYNKDRIILRVMLKGGRKNPGHYTCSAINTLGSKDAEIELKILEPPTKLKDAQLSKVSVLAGLPLFLSCPWSKDRATTIQWVKNGFPLDTGISDDRGTLSIPATSISNAGLYACLAKNFGGESKKEFDVQIRGTPYYDIETATNHVILKCPEPEIPSDIVIWDELLIGTENITNNEVETSTDLTINDAHPLTIYTCYHEDFDSGVRTKKVELQVVLTATVGYLETFRTAYIGDQVRMYCPLVPENTKSNIDWLKEDRRIMNTRDKLFSRDRKMIVIREVKLEDEGTYKCRAVPGDTERGIVLRTKQNTPEWSDWEPWTPCTKSCGTGIHTRQRQCISPNGETWSTTGSYCLGDATEEETCNNFACPVNGNWTEWSDWKPCPDTCWDTIIELEPRTQRSRECSSPEPFMGGQYCLGSASEERLCENTPCPLHGGWSPWSTWSSCSVSCGIGMRTRRRQCNSPSPAFGGNGCVGTGVDTQRCRIRDC